MTSDGHREAVPPVASDRDRPLWSVMIPTHHCAGYLRETLASVLEQAICNILAPQSRWLNKVRSTPWILFLVSCIVQTGMWLERFVIVVLSLNRDFLPSSWGMYWWTKWDMMTLIGTMGFFTLLFFLFIRFMPAISIFELRTLLPQSKVKE